MKIKNWKNKLILILFLVSLASSLILTLIPLPLICSPHEGCYIVQNSPYAQTFGVSNELFGDIIFAAMAVIIVMQILKPTGGKSVIMKLGVFFGALTAIYFLYLQEFVIHAFCKYCLVVDFSMILAFAMILIPEKKNSSSEKIKLSIEEA